MDVVFWYLVLRWLGQVVSGPECENPKEVVGIGALNIAYAQHSYEQRNKIQAKEMHMVEWAFSNDFRKSAILSN